MSSDVYHGWRYICVVEVGLLVLLVFFEKANKYAGFSPVNYPTHYPTKYPTNYWALPIRSNGKATYWDIAPAKSFAFSDVLAPGRRLR